MLKNIKKIIEFLCSMVFCTAIIVGMPKMVKAAEEIAIDETNFPDVIFRDYVTSEFDKDNSGGLSEKEIAEVREISVFGYDTTIITPGESPVEISVRIKTLKGVEYFTALHKLDCFDNELTTLDLSNNTKLVRLECSNNKLTSLDLSNNTNLQYLYCFNNELTSLNVSNSKYLTELACSYNQLTNLDVSNNKYLTTLFCAFNQLTDLNLRKNVVLTDLDCQSNQLTRLNLVDNPALTTLISSNNQLETLMLNSYTYDILELYTGYLQEKHDFSSLSDLQNVTIDNIDDDDVIGLIKVTDITKPATYKVNDKSFTIIYENIGIMPSPSPVVPSDAHIFSDYNYSNPITDNEAVIYGNGANLTVDGKKVNNKIFTTYTDILASYKYTLNSKGIVKPSIGKVIVGITKSDVKPEVNSKNKIIDTSASKIARAKIKNGQITVTAVGKESGLVYLWVIDTGSKGVSACCPINVKLAPTKLEVQNTSGSKLAKNTKLENGKTLDVCVAGLVGSTKTEDGTYTVTMDSKYQSYITVTPAQGSTNKFTIKATGLKNNKDTKVTVTFKCDQNGKKTNLSLTITN